MIGHRERIHEAERTRIQNFDIMKCQRKTLMGNFVNI